jgi:F-type H+-transporting ATPase subunit b
MSSGVLLTAASGSEHPLIYLDFTVLVQLVLFALTALVATRFLFRPFLQMRDERIAGIEGARAEAARTTAQADAQATDYEGRLAQARARAEEERRKLRAEAAAHEREVVDRTRAQAVQAQTEAETRIAEQTAAARAQLRPRADEIAKAVAKKLLGREVSA